MVSGEDNTLAAALGAVQTRLRWQRTANTCLRGLPIVIGVALAAWALERGTGLPVGTAGLGLAIALLGLTGLVTFLRAPTLAETARRADRQLQLADRLATAWELRAETAPLATLQRADALATLAQHNLRHAFPIHWPRRNLLAALLLAGLMVAIIIWPRPETARARQLAADAPAIQAAAQAVAALTERATDPSVPYLPPTRSSITQELAALQRTLAEPQTREEAAAAIAQREATLRRLADPATRDQRRALDALAAALRGLPASDGLARALADQQAGWTAEEADRLGATLANLTPEERAALADGLQQAANAARSQGALATPLRQAARALANNDLAGARQALEQFGQAAGAAQNRIIAQQALETATRELETARQTLAGNAAETTARASHSPSAQNNRPDTPAGGALPPLTGEGAGTGPRDTGATGATAPGSGTGSAPTGAPTPRLETAGERVTLPGQPAGAPMRQSIPGGMGTADHTAVPYQQVIGEYAAAARDYVERAVIPPALREAVRTYFDGLEGR